MTDEVIINDTKTSLKQQVSLISRMNCVKNYKTQSITTNEKRHFFGLVKCYVLTCCWKFGTPTLF